jgi:hypothetical protein
VTPNLADPDFEPTDEQLIELSRRAFAGVREQRERAQQALRAEIEVERDRVLRRLAERARAGGRSP